MRSLLVLLLGLLALLAACATPPIPADPGKQWQLTFNEEFSGPGHKLATAADWNEGQGNYSFNAGREWYYPCGVTVSGGTAKLTARPNTPQSPCVPPFRTDPPTAGPHEGYTSGMVATNRKLNRAGEPYVYSFQYGYAEARLKLPPETPGFFSAFFTLDQTCNGTTYCTTYSFDNEIDILEVLGDDATMMWQTMHTEPDRSNVWSSNWYRGSDGDYNGECPQKRYDTAFHTFGMDWTPTHVAVYIDGKECARRNVSPSEPMYLLVMLFVDHAWEVSQGSMVSPIMGVWPTRTLEVDYLRVWQQSA